MTRARTLALFLPLLLVGCTGKKNTPPSVSADSVRANDSAVAAPAAVPPLATDVWPDFVPALLRPVESSEFVLEEEVPP